MRKTKILGILVGILSIINIGLLVFLFLGKPKGPGPRGFGNEEQAELFIQDKFGFDIEQMSSFRESKNNHMQKARQLEEELEDVSLSFYMVGNTEGTDERDSLMARINDISTKIYNNNVMHFEEVRSICTPDQKLEMEGFISGLFMQKGKGRMRDNPKNK